MFHEDGDGTRGNVSFEDCIVAMEEGRRLADIPNPNAQYPNQRLLGAEIGGYACCVPYVEDRDEMFLKTIYPSRRFTELYLKG